MYTPLVVCNADCNGVPKTDDDIKRYIYIDMVAIEHIAKHLKFEYEKLKNIFIQLSLYIDNENKLCEINNHPEKKYWFVENPYSLEDIAEIINLNIDETTILFEALKKQTAIRSIEIDKKECFVINPGVTYCGNEISIELYNMFVDTWLNVGDKTAKLTGLTVRNHNKLFKKKSRTDSQYDKWRNDVIQRDNQSCVICGRSDIALDVHHIRPYASNKELRIEISNGLTLCECHHNPFIVGSFHQMYGTRKNTPEQLQEYIDNERQKLGLTPITIDEIINKSNTTETPKKKRGRPKKSRK